MMHRLLLARFFGALVNAVTSISSLVVKLDDLPWFRARRAPGKRGRSDVGVRLDWVMNSDGVSP